MRCLALLALVASSSALAEPARELAPGVQMVPVQEASLLVLTDAGLPEDAPTRVPAGYWVSLTGYERLQAAMSQVQADKAAAEAKAGACVAVAGLPRVEPARPSTVAVLGMAFALVLVGGAAGYSLRR